MPGLKPEPIAQRCPCVGQSMPVYKLDRCSKIIEIKQDATC